MRNRRSGFTVIELLIVLTMMGLVGIAVAMILKGRGQPKGSLESPRPAIARVV